MKNHPTLIRWSLLLVLPALLFVGACDTFSSADDDDHDDEEHHDDDLARVQLETRDGTDEVVAVWTDDDGWDVDALPAIDVNGDHAVWTVRMFVEDGDEIELVEGGEFEARYAVDGDAPQDVIYFDASGDMEVDGEELELFHGDHVHVYPQNVGTTRIRFLLWHDNHSDDDTAFIDLVVEDSGANGGA